MLSCLDDSDEDPCFYRGRDCYDVEDVPGTQFYEPVAANEECNLLLPTVARSSDVPTREHVWQSSGFETGPTRNRGCGTNTDSHRIGRKGLLTAMRQ